MLKDYSNKICEDPPPKKKPDKVVRAGYVTTNKMSIFLSPFQK